MWKEALHLNISIYENFYTTSTKGKKFSLLKDNQGYLAYLYLDIQSMGHCICCHKHNVNPSKKQVNQWFRKLTFIYNDVVSA